MQRQRQRQMHPNHFLRKPERCRPMTPLHLLMHLPLLLPLILPVCILLFILARYANQGPLIPHSYFTSNVTA